MILTVNEESQRKSDVRRDWALIVVTGGGMAMTAYAAAALWLVRIWPTYVFWLGAGAMATIMLVFTGILGLLVKRSLSLSKTELKIADYIDKDDAQEAVQEALEEIPSK